MRAWRRFVGLMRDQWRLSICRHCRRWAQAWAPAVRPLLFAMLSIGLMVLLAQDHTGKIQQSFEQDAPPPERNGGASYMPWAVEPPALPYFAPGPLWPDVSPPDIPDLTAVPPGQASRDSEFSARHAAQASDASGLPLLLAATVIGGAAVITAIRRRRSREHSRGSGDIPTAADEQHLACPTAKNQLASPTADVGATTVQPQPAGPTGSQAVNVEITEVVPALEPPTAQPNAIEGTGPTKSGRAALTFSIEPPATADDREQSSRVVLFRRESSWG